MRWDSGRIKSGMFEKGGGVEKGMRGRSRRIAGSQRREAGKEWGRIVGLRG